MRPFFDHFGGHIIDRAAEGVPLRGAEVFRGPTEVADLDVVEGVQKDVFRLCKERGYL